MRLLTTLFLILGFTVGAQSIRLEKSVLLPVDEKIKDDPEVASFLAPFSQEIKASYARVIGESSSYIPRGYDGEEKILGYWITDVMRERAEACLGLPVKAAIYNAGGIRSSLAKGQIKIFNIYEILPFENELVVVEYSGGDFCKLIKEAVGKRGGEPLAGVKVALTGDLIHPNLCITWSNGEPINLGEKVRVAISDYLLANGDGLNGIRKACNPVFTGQSLRQILIEKIEYLTKAGQVLLPSKPGRIELAPVFVEQLKAGKAIF